MILIWVGTHNNMYIKEFAAGINLQRILEDPGVPDTQLCRGLYDCLPLFCLFSVWTYEFLLVPSSRIYPYKCPKQMDQNYLILTLLDSKTKRTLFTSEVGCQYFL